MGRKKVRVREHERIVKTEPVCNTSDDGRTCCYDVDEVTGQTMTWCE